MYVLNIIHKI